MLICIQVLAFFTVVLPHLSGTLKDHLFYLVWLVLMTVLSAAGGYIINDLMDREADQKNGRNNVLNSGNVSAQTARRSYLWSLIFGALFSVDLSKWSLHFLWLYVVVILFLWLYSKYLKRLPLIGNLAVSTYCAGAVGILWSPAQPLHEMPKELMALTVFAFLVTLIREIVKDLEDMEGDKQVGDKTLPIEAGVSWSILLVILLHLVVIAGLFYPEVRPRIADIPVFSFWVLTLILFFATPVYLAIKARERVSYHRISLLLKLAMLTGTLFIVL